MTATDLRSAGSATPPRPDLADVQGGVLKAYGTAFPHASYVFLHVGDPVQGRRWLSGLLETVTDAVPGRAGHLDTTLNVALTATGLLALGVSPDVVATFSTEFRQGMAARAEVLGDVGVDAPAHWDGDLGTGRAHVVLVVAARSRAVLRRRLDELTAALAGSPALREVHTVHGCALPEGREHFGFKDGSAQPAVEGVTDSRAEGGGVFVDGRWRALSLGEFLLGHPDEEARGFASAPLPSAPTGPLGHNGTYAVWRRLEQDVALFRRTVREAGLAHGISPDLVAAKIVGRWPNGTPLALSPDAPDPDYRPGTPGANDFRYRDADRLGHRCPVGAHVRRANPRDSTGFGMSLTFRHRMIRRGVPYGPVLPPGVLEPDGRERGLVFVCFVASIARQFESVQVQWLEDGNSLGLGRDKDPLLRGPADGTGKMTVQGSPPRVLAPQRSFVRVRGGEYLFVPGITALGAVADGVA